MPRLILLAALSACRIPDAPADTADTLDTGIACASVYPREVGDAQAQGAADAKAGCAWEADTVANAAGAACVGYERHELCYACAVGAYYDAMNAGGCSETAP